MRRPLVHIGYHETGTTWLQRHLFGVPSQGYELLPRRDVQAAIVHQHPSPLTWPPDARASSPGW